MKRGRFLIETRVKPGANKTDFAGWIDGRLGVRVRAPAEKGKANKELLAFIAKAFEISKSDVAILRGEKSREKILALSGDPKELKARYEEITKRI